MNYNSLINKPTINNKELIGNNKASDIGGLSEEEMEQLLTTDLTPYYTKAQIDNLFSRSYVYREKSDSIVTFDCPSTPQNIPEVTVKIVAVQSGTGDPSPTNVRPISGWSAVNVNRTGSNIWDEEWEVGGISNINGENYTLAERIRSKNYISVKANTPYYLYLPNTYSSPRIACYDKDKEYLGQATGWLPVNNNTTFTTPSNTYYIRFVVVKADETYNNDISINYPSADTSYHAYNDTTTPIAFTVNGETKTIYSGYVEIKNGKVKAVAERKFNTFAELSNLYNGAGNDVVCAFISMDEMKPNSRSNGIANYFASTTSVINQNLPWQVCFGINNQRIYFTFDPEVIGGNTLEDINNYVATNPIQVLYPLETPIEYDLADVSIATQEGTNNLWCDSGDITVKALDRIIQG